MQKRAPDSLKSLTRWLAPGDLVVAGVVLLAILVSGWLGWRSSPVGAGGSVVVELRGIPVGCWPIETRTDSVAGTMGLMVIRTEISGSVTILSTPCRDKVCQKMGSLESPGDASACLPNGLIVRIEGVRTGELDGISR